MQLPQRQLFEEGYAFHKTDPRNVQSIIENGIEARVTGGSETIIKVLDDLGYEDPFPFNRENATYCHVDREHIEKTVRSVERRVSLIVVDVNSIENDVYMGDMSVISDLIDFDVAGPDAMMHYSNPHSVIRGYENGIVKIESRNDITPETYNKFFSPELVVDGDIPPEAIVKTI